MNVQPIFLNFYQLFLYNLTAYEKNKSTCIRIYLLTYEKLQLYENYIILHIYHIHDLCCKQLKLK